LAHPDAVATRLFGAGAEIQDRFYHRGLGIIGRSTLRSFFIMQETSAPFALSVVELDYEAEEIGDEKVTRATEIWRDCIRTNAWPGYPRAPVGHSPP
jgi:hypothetical protein